MGIDCGAALVVGLPLEEVEDTKLYKSWKNPNAFTRR
jgi:hypothetical protein